VRTLARLIAFTLWALFFTAASGAFAQVQEQAEPASVWDSFVDDLANAGEGSGLVEEILAPVLPEATTTKPTSGTPLTKPGPAPTPTTEPASADAANDEDSSNPFLLGVTQDHLDNPFFEHTDFGFDLDTAGTLANDLRLTADAMIRSVTALQGRSTTVVWEAIWRPLVFVLLVFLAVLLDVYLKRRFTQQKRKVTLLRMSPRAMALRDSGLRMAGALSAPLLGWLVSFFMQGLFEREAWTLALSDSLMMFIVFRVLMTLLDESLSGIYFRVPPAVSKRIGAVVRRSLRAIVVLTIMLRVFDALAYRSDVLALLEFCIRITFTLMSFQLFALQKPLLALLPTDGSERYRMLRSFFARYLPYLLLGSVLLLGLWTAGFERAATTILSRLYSIIALIVCVIVVQRLFDEYVRGDRKPQNPVVNALLASIDGFARLCVYALFAWALLALLGLWNPLVSVLDAIGVRVGPRPITLLSISRGAIFVAGAVLLSRVLRTVLDVVIYPHVEMEMGAAYAINIALHYFIIAAAAGMSLVIMGVDLSALAVFSGALGIGLGFGLQDVAKNMISGFVLLFGGSIQKGDLISMGDTYGYVEKMGSRAVTLKTRDNYELLVPTKDLLNSTITNWTHSDSEVRLHIPVGVAYNSDMSTVKEALIKAARTYPRTIASRPVTLWLTSFGDSSVNFEILVWFDATEATPRQAVGEALFYVWDALAEAKISIPFPQRDLHIKSVEPPAASALQQILEGKGIKVAEDHPAATDDDVAPSETTPNEPEP
jgi:small-conductance mechanosensitive channel